LWDRTRLLVKYVRKNIMETTILTEYAEDEIVFIFGISIK
jgi:hypothetical protein